MSRISLILIRSIPIFKRNWKWILSAIVILWIAGWLNGVRVRYQRQVNELRETNIRLKRDMVEQWKLDNLSIVQKAEEVESLKGILESQVKATVKYKDLYLHERAKATITDSTVVVKFSKETKCHFAWGWTETNLLTGESIYDLSVLSQPVNLQIDITKIQKGEVWGRVKLSSDCLEIGRVKFNVPPELGAQIEYKTNWKVTGLALGLGIALGFFVAR